MILLISDKPSYWANNLQAAIRDNGGDAIILAWREFLGSSWSISYSDNGLVVGFKSSLIAKDCLCRAMFFSQIDFSFLPNDLTKIDMLYYRHAWFSLLVVLNHLPLPLYNKFDLSGVRLNWRAIYSLSSSKGVESILGQSELLDPDYALMMLQSWQQFSKMAVYNEAHSGFKKLAPAGSRWVYLHYLARDCYYISEYIDGVAVSYKLADKYIELGWELLDYCDCAIGTVLFQVSSQPKFVALSPELNWHYCSHSIEDINNSFSKMLTSLVPSSRFNCGPGDIKRSSKMAIANSLRPELAGGVVQT